MTRFNVRSLFNLTLAFVLAMMIGAVPRLGLAQAPAAGDSPPAETAAMFSDEELDELVGPIALYPDDLIAVLMPASTFPLDVVQAARFLEQYEKDPKLKPSEKLDASVLGLLNYPEVIKMMNDDLEWTERFGTAVINQQQQVMDAIQQFRLRTQAAGNLQSNEQQVIVQEKETIIIQSATPEVIYVPRYDPAIVVVYQPAPYTYYYSSPYPYYYSPAAVFWTGMFVGTAVRYGIYGGNGWRHGDVRINRNTNVNINVNRPNGGSSWKPNNRPGNRPGGGNRPGYRPGGGTGNGPGGGGGAKRPSAGTRPSTGSRPSTSTRPATGSRPSAATRPSQRPSGGSSGKSSIGNYNRGAQTSRDSSRGSQSRGAQRSSSGGRRSAGGGGRGGRR